ncbi:MAG TPA: DNA polymerase domain-containing protein [Candidatus Binatia bacterium]
MDQNWSQELPFHKNKVLFGHDGTAGLISFEVEGDDRIRIYSRSEGVLSSETVPLRPFLLLEGEKWLKGFKGDLTVETLGGEAPFNCLVQFPGIKAMESAKSHLQKKAGRGPSATDAPYIYLSDPVQLYLLLSGKTHFLGMAFGDLTRLQIDIETYCAEGFEFPNAERESDRITAIAMSDSTGWERLISGKDADEQSMLSEMVREVQERDPDVIEGHNFFRFDLEYLETRARRHKVPLELGRDGSTLKGHPSRMQIAERAITYRKYEIFGRHIVDTWILAQHYDVAARELPGYGLKEIARHFGVAPSDRTYIPAEKASWYFDHEPDTLFRYSLDDVRETRAISELLSQSYFVEAQVFPYSYQNVSLRGNATKIDSLFLREYLRQRHSIPRPETGKEVVGGFTAIEYQGVAKGVLHCDVTSLYPSIMLVYGFFPARDDLKITQGLLRDLREFRVKAKQMAREAKDREGRIYFSALQSTFKVLINSFYGYLGFSMGHFNDYDAANRVTAKGRELIQSAVSLLKSEGAKIIEIDTDGIYFVPPEGVRSEADQEGLIRGVAESLPKGIELELDGRYPAMFSYKIKNYALLDDKGRLLVKGSGLRSRGIELYQRQWMEEMLLLLMQGKGEEVPALYERYLDDLEYHRIDVARLMKTETLQDSLDNYQAKVKAKKRNAAAAYEIALNAERSYQPGDQISYYVTGEGAKVKVNENCKLASLWDPEHPDENVAHYKGKLKDLYEKFKPIITT